MVDNLFGGDIEPEWSSWLCRQEAPVTMATTTNLKVSVLHPKESYELYKQSVEFWVELTNVPVKKRAGHLVLNIPTNHPLGLKQKVLGSAVGISKLNYEDRVKNLLEYLSKIYAKDKFV